MPESVKGIRDLKSLLQDGYGILRLLAEIKTIESESIRESLLRLFDVIISLWMYWNVTGDEESEWHIKYYERKFFDLLSKTKGG